MDPVFIPLSELTAWGEKAARALPVTGLVPGRRIGRALRRALGVLRRTERRFHTAEPGEAGRWLLDNLYLAVQAAENAAEAFSRAGLLRAAGEETLILSLCRGLLRSGDGGTDPERVETYLEGFQRRTVLRRQELALFPAGLCAAAVLSLSEEFASPAPAAGRCGALFTTLRRLSAPELTELLERADKTEQILRLDPAGIYPRMDRASRESYRRQVERLARQERIPEFRAAEKALDLARGGADLLGRHVGTYLFEIPLGREKKTTSGRGYIAANAALSLGLAGLLGALTGSAAGAALSLLPLSQLVKEGVDDLLRLGTAPRLLPRLSLEEGVPPEGKTLCVVSVLLTGEKAVDAAVRRLEEFRMASRDCGDNLLFGILGDLPESREALTSADKALLTRASRAVDALNARRGGGFYFLCRERTWSRDTDRFIPWERKRGATLELCRLLAGRPSALECRAGDPAALEGTVYILTLDSDTRLEPESARRLIGTALHPLNMPVADLRRRVVIRGHAILQPRIGLELEAAGKTAFTRLFAPAGGGDPYGAAAGELYMDRYASGGFAGKGLIHVLAYLDCLEDVIPESRVLSHDALEGAFLRGGLVEDVALTDGCPSGAAGWFERQNRWVRGDWQNLSWLFGPGRELPPIERWRLFDSLRRSLLGTGLLAGLTAPLICPAPGTWAGAAVTAAVLLSDLIRRLLRGLFRPAGEARLRLRAGVLHGFGGDLTRALARTLLLPGEAWSGLSGAITAVWRMTVSRKNLLLWRTAEQADASAGVPGYYRKMWFCLAWGCSLLAAADGPLGTAAGLIWLLSPLLAFSLSRPRQEAEPLSRTDREWLLHRAGEMWRYFRDNCTPEDHYLPPDNVQLSPPAEPARRVSPTNLGLALVGTLSSLELGAAEEGEALALCEHLIASAEKLARWRGHFFNWYDTRTLEPLSPAYVSTVDSGNLWACLLTAEGGLRAHGAETLADRAAALRLAMDFAPLYDRERDLFRIGLEPGAIRPADSWYDLLESEERLTGYIAIASGQAPRRHWQRLSRARVGADGFRGMVSWTGTMFEYLLPELFLPLYRDSHLWESARFALYVQRQRTAGPDRLWGMSESAFNALDPTLHYRYKAHGCPRLALCRGMERDRVISPYSSYLALLVSPRAALGNLRRMERPEYMGPYGLWEAIDFTPGRSADSRGTAVRCIMAHHLGMSLGAVANVLCDGVLRRWFLSDPAMAAYTGLLQERVPLDAALLRRRVREIPARPRIETAEKPRTGEGTDYLHPETAALTNGRYRLLFTESGVSRALWDGLIPYAGPAFPWEPGRGVELTLVCGGERRSLLPHPGDGVTYVWEFSHGEAVLRGGQGGLSWSVTAEVGCASAGERRRVTIRRGENAPAAELILSLEPVLLPEKDYRAHPSFARLGLYTRERDGVLSVRRLARGTQTERYLALGSDREGDFSSDFRVWPGRSGGEDFSPNTGWQSQCRAAARVKLPAGEQVSTVCFALCADEREETAVAGVRSLLAGEESASLTRTAAARFSLNREDTGAAMALLPALFWPGTAAEGAESPAVPRDALWSLGISGDLPIHAVACADGSSVSAAAAEVRRHALLGLCGCKYDLVFLTGDDADYRRSVRWALEETLARLELPHTLGGRGGVHFASLNEHRDALCRAAALWTGETGLGLPERRTDRRALICPSPAECASRPEVAYDEALRAEFSCGPALPERNWSHMLTGGELGWLATESGTGFLWYKNARECPVTPWIGDPLASEGPEQLWIRLGERVVSFFARSGDEPCRVTFGFGEASWEKTVAGVKLRLTAFLPPERNVRVFLLQSSQEAETLWCAPLRLAPEKEDAAACRVSLEGERLWAENPRCPFPGLQVTARCSAAWESVSADAAAYLLGEDKCLSRCGNPGFCCRFRLEREAVLLLGTEDVPELLSPAEARLELEKTRRIWRARVRGPEARGGDTALLPWLNGWAAYQTLAFRVLGRASLYQSGGAIGFRDQLQDRVNLLWTDPAGCRAHILACCAHQFTEGDVQHWWHPGPGETDKGVRTNCSDDLLWLPWAVCEYVNATGDESLCAEKAPFLDAPPLSPGENSRYETPALSGETGSVLEHCRRAVLLTLRRGMGAHRLLKIGGGDWNDGFDAMGEGAESVWLTWFCSIVCQRFADLLTGLGEPDAERYAEMSRTLGLSANDAWDADHYLRGWYGDGTPLGASGSEACRIDSVAQSFAAFCPWADLERVDAALDAALAALWDRDGHRVDLYTPPFGPDEPAPGYVRTYGPGFRENGGQYTHAAVWLARACFRRGRWAHGAALLADLASAVREPCYGAEPWSVPADVYAAPGQTGRAGWTGYTGASGWWHRVAWEDMLGVTLQRGKLLCALPEPALERGWRVAIPAGEKEERNGSEEENNS